MCSTCRGSNSYTKHLWIHLGITAGNKNAMEMQVNYSSRNNQHKHTDFTLLQPCVWFRTKIRTKRCQIRLLACLSPTLTWLWWLVQRRERSGLAAPVPSILLDLCSHHWKCPADWNTHDWTASWTFKSKKTQRTGIFNVPLLWKSFVNVTSDIKKSF